MKIQSRISVFRFLIFLVLTLVMSSQSFGTATYSIHPADADDNLITYNNPGQIRANYNLERDPVLSNEDYTHTNSIEVDQNAGTIKGYSGYHLDSDRAITVTGNLMSTIAGSGEPAFVAPLSGGFYYEATVNGPLGSEVTPSYATVYLDIEGSFNYEFGAPYLGLGGGVSITRLTENIWDSVSYYAGGEYVNTSDFATSPDAASVYSFEALQVYDAMGNELYNPVIPGVTYDAQLISMDPDDLRMRVTLTVEIQDGDQLMFTGGVGGGATHSFLEDFSQLEVGEMGEVAAASGYVDFSNTAVFGIELPEGFTLEGDDAPPLSIINYSQVPVPGAVWLFGSAIAAFMTVVRRKKTKIF